MSTSPASLRELQAWMQAAITHPRGVLAATDAPTIDKTIEPSAQQNSLARLAIYQRAYFARLVEVMRECFPALVQALEQATFDALALAYLEQHPPRTYTLNRLADAFVDFLRTTRPARDTDGAPDWADFIIDLARLETAIEEVFDGPGNEDEPPPDLNLLQTAGGDLRLQLAPCVRLLELAFPLNDYYSAFRRSELPPIPPPAPTWLALYRRDYIVRRRPLSRGEFAVLAAIDGDSPLEDAVAAAIPWVPATELPPQLHRWFQDWAAGGIVVWDTRSS